VATPLWVRCPGNGSVFRAFTLVVLQQAATRAMVILTGNLALYLHHKQDRLTFLLKYAKNNNRILSMATTVTLNSEMVQEVQKATNEKSKAAAVRLALREYLRTQKLRKLADLAGSVDLRYSNDELEAMEEC
jgi:Arc/MetJ family transcription regulator